MLQSNYKMGIERDRKTKMKDNNRTLGCPICSGLPLVIWGFFLAISKEKRIQNGTTDLFCGQLQKILLKHFEHHKEKHKGNCSKLGTNNQVWHQQLTGCPSWKGHSNSHLDMNRQNRQKYRRLKKYYKIKEKQFMFDRTEKLGASDDLD